MTEKDPPTAAADGELCPHCGAVLDVALAIESDRSLLRRRRVG